jgi:hypothetical protein
MCNVCVCHCIFSIFIENVFVVNNCTRLKSTFGIRVVFGFRGTPLWLRVWLMFVINLVIVGDLVVLILQVKRNCDQFNNRDREI